jgi:hypothetical protein
MQIPARCGIKVILHIIWPLSTGTFFLFDVPFTGIPVWHNRLGLRRSYGGPCTAHHPL